MGYTAENQPTDSRFYDSQGYSQASNGGVNLLLISVGADGHSMLIFLHAPSKLPFKYKIALCFMVKGLQIRHLKYLGGNAK